MKNATTIFYVNSMGFMSQWKGVVIGKTETTISIRFSKNKAFRFDLKSLDIDFVLVTKSAVKDFGVCILKSTEAVCFDDRLKSIVLENTKGNVESLWMGKKWAA